MLRYRFELTSVKVQIALFRPSAGLTKVIWLALQKVNRRYLTGDAEEPQWELRMSLAFCSLLCVIVAVAFLLAMKGIYPK